MDSPYASTGDGGSGNDPPNNAQTLTAHLGKLLRLDVDSNPSTPPYYAIPSSNPFVGSTCATRCPEIHAYGLRNPWKFSFDRGGGLPCNDPSLTLGFDSQGRKHVLGIREGSTEKAQVVRSLLSDLIDRGLAAEAPRLWVIDGGKAIRRAIVDLFGASALVQRCQEHKRRDLHASVGRAMRDAWETKDHALGKRQLERLAHQMLHVAEPAHGTESSRRLWQCPLAC